MGALQGNVTVRRYQARGDKPKAPARLVKGARAHVLVPIDPKSDVEKVAGWATLADPTDLELAADKMFFGPTVALALRIDALVAPAQVVKRLVAEKLRQSGRKANRAEKQAAKAEVKKSLRSRYLPTMRATDVVWQTETDLVYVWSHGKHVNEVAIDLFYKSFGLELVPLGPGLVAGRGAIPAGTQPTPELVLGFPGMPGRAALDDEGGADA
jgi:recombination associated protein RdgC